MFSVWTDPQLIPEWWGDGTVVEEMDVRPGGTYRFRTGFGVVEGEFREVDAPERLVQTFQNHLQTLEFEDLGDRTKLTQTMRFATTEERDTTMQYGVEEGAKGSRAWTRCCSGYHSTREPPTMASMPSSKRTHAMPMLSGRWAAAWADQAASSRADCSGSGSSNAAAARGRIVIASTAPAAISAAEIQSVMFMPLTKAWRTASSRDWE